MEIVQGIAIILDTQNDQLSNKLNQSTDELLMQIIISYSPKCPLCDFNRKHWQQEPPENF